MHESTPPPEASTPPQPEIEQQEDSSPPKKTKTGHRLPVILFSIGVVLLMGAGAFLIFQHSPQLLEQFGVVRPAQENILPVPDETGAVPLSLESLIRRADTLKTSGDITEALLLYEQALREGGGVAVIRSIFDVALLLGDYKKAEEMLGVLSFHRVPENSIDALRGMLLVHQNDLENAQALFSAYPNVPEHVYGLSLVQMLRGEHDQAEKGLQFLFGSADPLLVHQAGVLQSAYDEFSLFEDGQESHRSTLLARALAQIAHCPLSELLLLSVTDAEPDYRDAWIVLGYCRLRMESASGALLAFEQAYALDPEKAETQYFLASAAEALGNMGKAKQFYEFALQNGFAPQRTVREKLMRYEQASGNLDGVAEHYRILLTTDEADGSLYRAFITLLLDEMNAFDEAQVVLEDARETIGEDDPDVLFIRGRIALVNSEFDEAAVSLNAATRQSSNDAEAWFYKGSLEEQVGDISSALNSYKKAYELSSGIDDDLARNAAERFNVLSGR